jgi:tetratricopeptide (TPR) repeat protein
VIPDLKYLAALLDAGRFVELELKTREFLASHSSVGVLWQILAVSLARQGKDALDALTRAAELSPDDAGAQNNLGNALGRLGRLESAVAHYRRALDIQPEFAEAHNNLGHALLDLGRYAEALASCSRSVNLKPDYAEAHDNLGSAQLASGKIEQALASYRRALQIEPNFAEAHSNLGNALLELGELDAALLSYRRALVINPDFAEAHNNLGNALRNLGELDAAEASYRRALKINPGFAAAHCNLGIALRLQGRTDLAQLSCRRALEIEPRSAAAFTLLAEASADRGDFAAAESLCRRAIAIDADSPEAWAALAHLRKMTHADATWLGEAQRIAAQPLPPRREIPLRHAIGKYLDDVREFEPAFDNFRRANELAKLRHAKFDATGLRRTVDRIIATYDQAWMNQPTEPKVQSARPIFIVGMLRSGTTLAEQILSSHPAVFGGGELRFWSAASENLASSPSSLAHEYLRVLHGLSADALRVTDKMPTNFAFLGLIHAALPNARIIHMQRNPLDTCLSIYFQHFETMVSYATDLEDLAQYYAEYRRVMQHWRSTLPGDALLDVPYEALVLDHEAWARKMLEFVGLPWDPRCLDFHRTPRAVITASKWQVRQQVHHASVGRWRNYEKFIGPLLHLVALDQ